MTDTPAPQSRQWQRLIETDDADPLEVLRTVGTYQRYLDAIEKQAVRTARGLGRTWEEVAGAMGVKRQSAWAKHGRRIPRQHQVAERPEGSPRSITLRCPGCDAAKEFRVSSSHTGGLGVYDIEADAHFLLPGPVLWTCPGCHREQIASVDVEGLASPVLWVRPPT